MAKFVSTLDTIGEIGRLINGAQKFLVLICPFVKIPELLLQNLKLADARKTRIVIVYGKRDLRPDERSRLTQFQNLSLFYLENLHAKCFFNEKSMIITSCNLYDASMQNNREMGVLLAQEEDPACYADALTEARLIMQMATRDEIRLESSQTAVTDTGYCIRCGEPIAYYRDKPLCSDCYAEWAKWNNPDYEEHYCHRCGWPASTTKEKPLCRTCYARQA